MILPMEQSNINLSSIKNFGLLITKEIYFQCGERNENKLAAAILERAILDLFIPHKKNKHNVKYDQMKAYRWIFHSSDFQIICDYAEINPIWLKEKIVKYYEKYHELYKKHKKKITT